jgi:hypothetical protein
MFGIHLSPRTVSGSIKNPACTRHYCVNIKLRTYPEGILIEISEISLLKLIYKIFGAKWLRRLRSSNEFLKSQSIH